MANTQGIPDEHLHDLLTLDMNMDMNMDMDSETSKTKSISSRQQPQWRQNRRMNTNTNTTTIPLPRRGLTERQRMMNEFESGGDMQPSAKVIRTGPRPVVAKSTSTSTSTSASTSTRMRHSGDGDSDGDVAGKSSTRTGQNQKNVNVNVNVPMDSNDVTSNEGLGLGRTQSQTHTQTQTSASMGASGGASGGAGLGLDDRNIMEKKVSSQERQRQRGVLISDSVMERPVDVSASAPALPKKMSRFKMRQQQKSSAGISGGTGTGTGTEGGFPSFDIPVGTLTRRGNGIGKGNGNGNGNGKKNTHDNPRATTTKKVSFHSHSSLPSPSVSPLVSQQPEKPSSCSSPSTTRTSSTSEADAMLANMSKEEIAESVAEIEGILSADTIRFLRKRHREKKKKNQNNNESKNKNNNKAQGAITTTTATTSADNTNDGISTSTTSTKGGTTSERKNVSFKTIATEAQTFTSTSTKDKEDMAKMLSGIKTEEELVEAFAKTVGHGLDGDMAKEGEEEEEETELESASKLLRSTSKRQRLLGAKRTCEWLDERLRVLSENNNGDDDDDDDDNDEEKDASWVEDKAAYSDILPVALRCLLDVPSPQKNLQMIEYVLRSIHTLTILFTPAEHRVDFDAIFATDHKNDADIIFQQEYMQDAVPIPSATECYSKSRKEQQQQPVMEKSSLGDGCYSTNASAESAKSDGKEFYSDPGWILLSKMKMIPCISNILISLTRESRDDMPISPAKITKAICGILAQMSLRSPGAAVAIAQHSDVIPKLITLSLEPGNPGEDGFVVDTKMALPFVFLLCILSRQSRSAAKSLEQIVETITYIVASDSVTDEELLLQKWCIIFWRSLLRYGLGISYLSTMLQLSIVHLASNSNQKHCLAPEYLSAFSIICECVKITTMHKGFKEPTNSKTISDSDRETLAMSGMWFSSHTSNCADDIIRGIEGKDIGEKMKIASTKVRFLSLYYDASSPSDIMGNAPTSGNLAFVPMISIETYIAVLDSLFDSQLMKDALQISLRPIYSSDDKTPIYLQARACSFVEACYFALRVLIEKTDPHSKAQEEEKISSTIQTETQLLRCKVFRAVIACLQEASELVNRRNEKLSQAAWINGAHFAVGNFLASDFPTYAASELEPSSVRQILPLIQSFICHLIGRLGRGEEKKAALLYSQDIVFTAVNADDTSISVSNMADIQDAMMRELCSNPRSQSQLDHSFKLSGRPGLSIKGKGHFSLESLRSETDFRESSSNVDEEEAKHASDQLMLPIGEAWAWKLLSSNISTEPTTSPDAEVYKNATSTVISSMEYLHYIATSGMPYHNVIGAGSKMYFLLNTCFYPEMIIRDENFESLFMKLFFEFRGEVLEEGACDKAKPFISFIITCNQHSRDNRSNDMESSEHDRLVDLLFNDQSDVKDDECNLSSKDFKAIDSFVDDICTAFIDFGAQYDSFTYAIRYLMMPGMPMRVRVRLLDKLKDLLHLLTTESESSDLSRDDLAKELGNFFLGGFSPIDKSSRDSAAYLDKLASLLGNESFTTFGRQKGFFYCYAVGCLARSLASSSVKCECGVKAMRRRMKNMASCIYNDVINCSLRIAGKACKSSNDIANVVIDVCFRESTSDILPGDFDEVVKKVKDLSGHFLE